MSRGQEQVNNILIVKQADFEEEIVKKIVADVLEVHYQVDKKIVEEEMNDLSKKIIDEILKELLKTKKSFKYSVTCFIQQKNGSALNFGSKQYNKSKLLHTLKMLVTAQLRFL